jgi:peptidoglycan/xylan/chitin deacetylase (PgdA/CDA1 family)
MSALADRLEGQRVAAGRRALFRSLKDLKKQALERGLPIVGIVSSDRPDLLMLMLNQGVARIAVLHRQRAISRLSEIAMRAAFALVDLTIVQTEAEQRSAVRQGADPDRIATGFEGVVERLMREPPRRDRQGAAMEAAASVALDAAEWSGAIRVAEVLTAARRVNVLNYHRILPIQELQTYGRPQMALAAPLLEAQLDEIAQLRGFTSVEQVHDARATGKVAVTFDDGYEDNFRVAFPILQRFSAPACIFLVTGLVGRPEALWWDRIGLSLFAYWRSGAARPLPPTLPAGTSRLRVTASVEEARTIISDALSELNRVSDSVRETAVVDAEALIGHLAPPRTMLSWDEIEQMQRLGVRFGCHTRSHICLDEVPLAVAREELFGSQHDLEERLPADAHQPRLAALPRGRVGELTEAELKEHGFTGVMTTEIGVNDPKQSTIWVKRRDGKLLTLRGRHHPAKLRLELTGILDRFRSGLYD